MKEAIGGSYIFQIVIIFIALFSGFLVYSISYTKAFRVKNEIINLIENNLGYTTSDNQASLTAMTIQQLEDDPSVEAQALKIIKNYGYKHSILDGQDDLCYINNESVGARGNAKDLMRLGGYCLYKICNDGDGTTNTVYKVTTFIALKIPVINTVVKIPISGQTRTIYSDNGRFGCTQGREIE